MPDSETFCSYCKKMTSFECVECGDLVEDFFSGISRKGIKGKSLACEVLLREDGRVGKLDMYEVWRA